MGRSIDKPQAYNTIAATKAVDKPESLDDLRGPYCVLTDIAKLKTGMCEYLSRALNVMASRGWRPVCMSTYRDLIYVIMTQLT